MNKNTSKAISQYVYLGSYRSEIDIDFILFGPVGTRKI